MIPIDFLTGVTVFLAIPIALVFILWIFYNFSSPQDFDYQAGYLQQCPFCTYAFFTYNQDPIKTCPRCQSLIANEGQEKRSNEKTNSP